jgi:hypothetical protein
MQAIHENFQFVAIFVKFVAQPRKCGSRTGFGSEMIQDFDSNIKTRQMVVQISPKVLSCHFLSFGSISFAYAASARNRDVHTAYFIPVQILAVHPVRHFITELRPGWFQAL